EYRLLENKLLVNIQTNLEKIDSCLNSFNSQMGYEEVLYRFFCQSLKVFSANGFTSSGFELLKSLDPKDKKSLDESYSTIVKDALSRKFSLEMNNNWVSSTQPVVDAFLQTKYFLEMASKYGHKFEKDKAPVVLPYGWAALGSLYKFR
ncbi:MAG: hypothetical protein WCI72_06440, partial [archaeon]